MDGCGTVDHEGVGAAFLSGLGLHDDVCFFVGQHVNAKRRVPKKRDMGYG
jgi:hypothetical protein